MKGVQQSIERSMSPVPVLDGLAQLVGEDLKVPPCSSGL